MTGSLMKEMAADATKQQLFNTPETRKIAGVLSDAKTLKLLYDVQKLDAQYVAGRTTLGEWHTETVKLATDAVLGPCKEAEALKKKFEMASVSGAGTFVVAFELALLSFTSDKFRKTLDNILTITDTLMGKAISQKYGVTKEYMKSLSGLEVGGVRLGYSTADKLLETKKELDGQLKTNGITRNEWDKKMKAAIAEVIPKSFADGIEEIRAFLAKTTVETIRTEAVYKKIRKAE